MNIEITSTDKITRLDGVPVRVWEGITERGVPCLLFVHRLAVKDQCNVEEFDRELEAKLPPGRVIPMAMIL